MAGAVSDAAAAGTAGTEGWRLMRGAPAATGGSARVNVSMSVTGRAPLGLVGQAFASTEPRHGRVDEYPASGTFRTSAMAEGATAFAPSSSPSQDVRAA